MGKGDAVNIAVRFVVVAVVAAALVVNYETPGVGGCTLCVIGPPPPPPTPEIVSPVPSSPTNALMPLGCGDPSEILSFGAGVHGEIHGTVVGNIEDSLDLLSSVDSGVALSFAGGCDPKLTGTLDDEEIEIDLGATTGAPSDINLKGFTSEDAIGGTFNIDLDVMYVFGQGDQLIANTLLHELNHVRERKDGSAGSSCEFDRSNDPACATETEIAAHSATLEQMCTALCECVDLTMEDKAQLAQMITEEWIALQQKLDKVANGGEEGADAEPCPYCTEAWGQDPNSCDCEGAT